MIKSNDQSTKSTSRPELLFLFTLLIGISYQFIPVLFPENSIQFLGTVWNVVFSFLVGFFLLRGPFLEQFKHFKFTVLLYGIPLVLVVGIASSLIFSTFIGQTTTNSISEVLTKQMIFTQIPLMLLGEELLSTNLILALEAKGMSFKWASLICGVLFALWHIPAYGFHIAQLLITLMPVRLALNYVWKKSSSVWVSWICHFLYDGLSFIGMLVGK
ncbi:CPBP family intramembrane glutamic endopeptidase [Enterococcus crotali]|uniref:CPBP family intramembrane glutamic endopeptidase n=1 Tax=Enterococcus crotali TaxID=1453587 RepID=UPI00046F48BE|nr:type II CAAX endopeptidase family protein [Enterococcus crotali]